MLKQININMQKFLVPLFDYLFGFALWGLGLTLMISLIFNVNCCFWRYLPKIIAIKIEQRSKNLILFSKIKLIFNPDADIILLSIFWHLWPASNLWPPILFGQPNPVQHILKDCSIIQYEQNCEIFLIFTPRTFLTLSLHLYMVID